MEDENVVIINKTPASNGYAYCKKDALELAAKQLSHLGFKMWVLLIEKGYPYFGGKDFYDAIPMNEDEIDDALKELVEKKYIDVSSAPVKIYEFPGGVHP